MSLYDPEMFGTGVVLFTDEEKVGNWILWLEEFGPGCRAVYIKPGPGASVESWAVVPMDLPVSPEAWFEWEGVTGYIPDTIRGGRRSA